MAPSSLPRAHVTVESRRCLTGVRVAPTQLSNVWGYYVETLARNYKYRAGPRLLRV
jgi:hypothetical protein